MSNASTHDVERPTQVDPRRATVLEREVWEAITDVVAAERVAGRRRSSSSRARAARSVCRYEDGEERRGEVELVEEAERLAFRWHREGGDPSRVELIVDAVAGGTRLTVIETGLVAETPPLCRRLGRRGWGACDSSSASSSSPGACRPPPPAADPRPR